jgi:lysophospholipase L1-like esterase
MKSPREIFALTLSFCVATLFGGGCAARSVTVKATPAAVDPARAALSADGKTSWFNALAIGLDGQGWKNLKHPYDRLPAAAESKVTKGVWELSNHSAGLSVGFVTDSPFVSVRWSLRLEELAMNHMPATGVSGVDLYAKRGNTWRWVATGRPEKVKGNEKTLVDGAPAGRHEYRLYLPLYNGPDSLEIGIQPGSRLAKATAYPANRAKPMLFWGTSILQGGCASRPGMAYPSIIGRWMQRPVINLGLSGNGKMDPEVTAFVAALDVSIYVIDCAPNMTPELIQERTEPLVRALRAAHRDTPIVLVENTIYEYSWFIAKQASAIKNKNDALRAAYSRLVRAGVKNLHYIPADHLLGDDGEATVDGGHASDLGFLRMANGIEPVLRRILE